MSDKHMNRSSRLSERREPPATKADISDAEIEKFTEIYPQICTSYHKVREMRAKLLAFLPLATSGIFLLLTKFEPGVNKGSLALIGIYGFLVTIGLFVYERANMNQLYYLIHYGSALEQAAGIQKGQFDIRKRSLEGTGFPHYSRQSGTAAWLIYGATSIAWVAVSYIGWCNWR